jgi:hypothetical protein
MLGFKIAHTLDQLLNAEDRRRSALLAGIAPKERHDYLEVWIKTVPVQADRLWRRRMRNKVG